MSPEQAVRDCVRSMEMKRLSSRHVRAILRCERVDVAPVEPFLNNPEPIIRAAAVTIIGAKALHIPAWHGRGVLLHFI